MRPWHCVACAALALAACGEGADRPPPARAYADPGFVEAATWRLHYALTPTPDLPSEIAGSYGVEQRSNRALLLIALAAREGSAAQSFDAASVEATAVSLTGNRTALPLRRVDESGGPTWIATVAIRHREPVTIEILARRAAGETAMRARLTRAFPVE